MKTNDDSNPSIDQLMTDLKTLVAEAEALMANTASTAGTDTLETLQQRFAAAQERISAAYDNARQKVVAGAKYTDEVIRENPYQAIAVAAGIGLVVGWLISRRNDK